MTKSTFCPFSESGCRSQDGKKDCMFWRPRIGCELQRTLAAVRTIPNLLRRLEKHLEEGKPYRKEGA